MDSILKKYGIKYPSCGAETGPGWYPIIESLISDLISMGWDKDCHQIKEKFGSLRFYIGASTKDIDERIGEAENASSLTCEECGDRGVNACEHGWYSSRCGPCRAKRVSGR